MIVIADSNLFISGLYTPNGVIATIIKTESKIQFLAPDFIFEEINNHINEIMIVTKKSKKDLKQILNLLTKNVSIIEISKIPLVHINAAIEIVKDIDIDDTFFVALHLFKKHKIWTTDKPLRDGLILKGYDICISTTELKTKIYKKNR